MSNPAPGRIGLGLVVGGALLLAGLWLHDRTATSLSRARAAAAPVTAAGRPGPAPATRPVPARRVPVARVAPGTAWPSNLLLEQCRRDYLASVAARVAVLETSAEPRDLLGAALLRHTYVDRSQVDRSGRGDSALHAFAAAVEHAPDDALAAWLYTARCLDDRTCDHDAAIGHWLKVEPDNAASWLTALDLAVRRGDVPTAEALLRRAAAAPRIDVHWGDTAQLGAQAIGQPATTPACVQVIGQHMGLDRPGTSADLAMLDANTMPHMPILAGLVRLCPTAGAIPEARLPACRDVFRLMANSDMILLHWFGLHAMSVHAEPAERESWLRRLREARWMQEQAPPLFMTEYVPLAWQQGEVAVMIALLQEAGRWPAPDDWQPPPDP